LKLNDKVKFLPGVPREELLDYISGATVGIIPYQNSCLNHWFCSPNKIWENPMANVPIVVSPYPELKKVIKEYDIGWMLNDPINAQNIASVLNRLTTEEIDQKRENCKNFQKNERWEIYGDKLIEAYKGIQTSESAQISEKAFT